MTSAQAPTLAPGCRLDPAPDLRVLDGGRVMIGGAPLRILRLSPAGAELATKWFAGQPIEEQAAHRRLARRLEEAGLAHLRWPRTDETRWLQVTVVVPTHDDPEELMRTLDSLRWAPRVIVVDDGSTTPVAVDEPAAPVDLDRERQVDVVRRPTAGGPAAARNQGLDRVETPLALFVDAGVTIDRAAASVLLSTFEDPEVLAVAPRVLSEPGPGLVARYERHRSPLDLGPTESLVGPGRAVPYVPTACLAVRVDPVRAIGGFDPDLRYGEDVDLVWRLGQRGRVRYRPEATVTHRPRPSVGGLIGQRRSYGSAAAPLARRHGVEALTPCRVSPWSGLILGLVLAGHPWLAVSIALGTGAALRPKIEPMPAAGTEAMLLTLRGHWYGGLGIVTALLRAWAPLALVGMGIGLATGRGPGGLAGRAIATAVFRRLADGPRDPADAVVDLSIGAIDDLAYCAGVWEGASRERSMAALRPILASWPGGDRTIGRWLRTRFGSPGAGRPRAEPGATRSRSTSPVYPATRQ